MTTVDEAAVGPKGKPNQMMITLIAMSATVMQVLDTTIANVALPHMQGSLGATQDQIAWVLTSYIVISRDHRAADRLGCRKTGPHAGLRRVGWSFYPGLDPLRFGDHPAADRHIPRAAGCGGAPF